MTARQKAGVATHRLLPGQRWSWWRGSANFRDGCDGSALLTSLGRPDLDLGRECAVDRTLVGDLDEPRALGIVEIAGERDGPVDAIEHPFFRFAALAIGGMDLGVTEPHGDLVKRQRLAFRV